MTSWGPSVADVDDAAAIVAAMPVEQQAGRVIMARVPGTVASGASSEIVDLGLGGAILFDDNLDSPQQVRDLNAGLQAAASAAGSPAPLLIGVDQEGGTVARVTAGATEFPTYSTLGAARDPAVAARAASTSGEELRALGFTVVFAPVADITIGLADPTIGSRSAGDDPALVAKIVNGSVEGYVDAGLVPVIKHFPGHGSVPADSHETLPVQPASLEELEARDLVPFRAAVAAGAPSVMVAHIDVRTLDPGVPASLSPRVVGLLRDDIGFEGLVFTDAEEMAAVSGTYGVGDSAVRALAAGVDVVLMPLDAATARAAIVAAVAPGRFRPPGSPRPPPGWSRPALWQARTSPAQPALDTVGSPDHHQVSYDTSLAGLTVVSGPCTGRLVGDAIQVVGGTETDRARLAEAAEAAGLPVGSGSMVRLLGSTTGGPGDIVVSLDRPYGLAASSAGTARIALYGRTPDAFRALVDVLLGTASGAGALPVQVEGARADRVPVSPRHAVWEDPVVQVILDVDTGIDDALAILLACRAPAMDVRAITCVAGNADVDQVVANTLRVLDAAGAPDIPVARGMARPLIEPPRPARHVHGEDGMGDLGLPESRRSSVDVHAVELMRATLAGATEPITLIPLAPLTNVAVLVRSYPELLERLERIVLMGGAAAVGNATAAAEFNVWHDPEAAAIVLDCGVEVTMYGLDVFYAPAHRGRHRRRPGRRRTTRRSTWPDGCSSTSWPGSAVSQSRSATPVRLRRCCVPS